MTTDLHRGIRGMVRWDKEVSNIESYHQRNQEAVTARALEKISSRQMIEHAQTFHSKSPFLPEIQKR